MQKGGEKKNHKWFARIGQSGAYKYFYSQAELAAYKAHQAGSAIKNKIGTAKKRMEVKKKVNDIYKGHEKARKIAEKFEKKQNSVGEAFKDGFSYTYSVRKNPKKMEERLREINDTKTGSFDARRLTNRAMTERDAKKGRLKNLPKAEVRRLADSYNKRSFKNMDEKWTPQNSKAMYFPDSKVKVTFDEPAKNSTKNKKSNRNQSSLSTQQELERFNMETMRESERLNREQIQELERIQQEQQRQLQQQQQQQQMIDNSMNTMLLSKNNRKRLKYKKQFT